MMYRCLKSSYYVGILVIHDVFFFWGSSILLFHFGPFCRKIYTSSGKDWSILKLQHLNYRNRWPLTVNHPLRYFFWINLWFITTYATPSRVSQKLLHQPSLYPVRKLMATSNTKKTSMKTDIYVGKAWLKANSVGTMKHVTMTRALRTRWRHPLIKAITQSKISLNVFSGWMVFRKIPLTSYSLAGYVNHEISRSQTSSRNNSTSPPLCKTCFILTFLWMKMKKQDEWTEIR